MGNVDSENVTSCVKLCIATEYMFTSLLQQFLCGI